MKQFKAEAAKELIATFEIDGNLFESLGGTWKEGIEPFFKEHPEYKHLPYEGCWAGGGTYVCYSIYSIGNITIVEK